MVSFTTTFCRFQEKAGTPLTCIQAKPSISTTPLVPLREWAAALISQEVSQVSRWLSVRYTTMSRLTSTEAYRTYGVPLMLTLLLELPGGACSTHSQETTYAA